MRLGLRFWGFHHAIVDRRHWQREQEVHSPLANYEVLDLIRAEMVLRRIARQDADFLNRLGREFLWPFRDARTASGSYGRQEENQRLLKELTRALGTHPQERGEPPSFARFYVCQRKPAQFVAEPRPPLIEPIETDYPRVDTQHYVVIETVDAEGHRVPGIRCELVIAGGEVRTVSTGPEGMVHVDRIQAGRVIIRVLNVDGSMWRPLEGEPSQPSASEASVRWHHTVQGDCLSKIAHRYGVKGWKVIWDHPKNADLRKKRKSPHVLYPGDPVAVPGVKVHEMGRVTDATHRIEVKGGGEIEVRLRLHDSRQKPLAGLEYALEFKHEGRIVARPGVAATDSQGVLTEAIPVGTEEVTVSFKRPRQTFHLAVGYLDPVRDEESQKPIASGVQARLNGLGYGTGEGAVDLEGAIAMFQQDHLGRDDADGHLDEQTMSKLSEMYGV